MRADQYQQITDRIVTMLEAGTRPWVQPWSGYPGGGRPLRHDGQRYRGANVLNLWAAGQARRFRSPYWMTFKRAKELGASVKKGAKSELAFYAGAMERTQEVNGQETAVTIPFLNAYPVFNAEEITGLKPHFYAPQQPAAPLDPALRIPSADRFVACTGARIVDGGSRAFYRHEPVDEIHMPDFAAFENAPAYYGILLHELTHWTGATTRLDRTKGKMFGDPAYAFEELVAELGAAYLSADLDITATPRADHAQYIAAWIKGLKSDNRAIFRAASLAERACTFLHDAQPAEMETIAA